MHWINSTGKIQGDLFWRDKLDKTWRQAIFVNLGSYSTFTSTVIVRGIWVFDTEGKLADIQVQKDEQPSGP
jgi:hypothetical protein